MSERDAEAASDRPMIYCIVPDELARALHETLRRHFADDPTTEVVVERRRRERRGPERRAGETPPPPVERRVIRNRAGRRIDDRRAAVVSVPTPPLPRKANRYADRLVFIERVEPSGERAEDLDTARLVTRIQEGDSDAYADLYTRYFARVYAYVRLLMNDPHEAEDVTQEVFLRVLAAVPRYEYRGQPFRSWLFTIVRNHTISHLRKISRVEAEEPAAMAERQARSSASSSDPSALTWISDPELLMLIERLPLAQRQVLLMRYLLDLTSPEIARILKRAPEDVRKLQQRALRFLNARLTALGRVPTGSRRDGWRRRVPQSKVLRKRRFALTPQ